MVNRFESARSIGFAAAVVAIALVALVQSTMRSAFGTEKSPDISPSDAMLCRASIVAPVSDRPVLHVSALIGPEKITITAARTDYGSPLNVTEPGPVNFQALDERGKTLLTATAPLLVIDPGKKIGATLLNVAIARETAVALHTIRISYAGMSELRSALPGRPVFASATAVDAGHVRVSFDGTTFQSLTVRSLDDSPNESDDIESDGSSQSSGVVATTANDLYLDFNDGVKTVARAIEVHVEDRFDPLLAHRADALPADQLALHVFVIVDENGMRFTDAWTDFGSPFHVTDPGPVMFEGFDACGRALFSATSQLEVVRRGDHTGSAELDVPILPQTAAALHSLRATFEGRSVTRSALPGGDTAATATAIDAHRIRVTFDGTKFQSLTVRPSGTSADNSAFVDSDGTTQSSGIVDTEVGDVYVDFENGVKTVARAIKVHVAGR